MLIALSNHGADSNINTISVITFYFSTSFYLISFGGRKGHRIHQLNNVYIHVVLCEDFNCIKLKYI